MDFLNPWWRGRLEEDPHLAKWAESPVRWIPKWVYEVDLTPFSLHFLLGPRQVGKTTALKLLIKRLVEEGRDPRSIFYYSCELVSDHKELAEVLREVAKLKERWGVASALIILDEVTYPREWYRALKFFIDQGFFKNDVIIASGSVSMYAKREVETFPGRRGRGRDYVLYPLSFAAFAKLAGVPEGADPAAWRSKLAELLELYLDCGGMPTSVISCLTGRGADSQTWQIFISSLSFDLARLGRSEAYVKRLLRAVLRTASSPVSLSALAKEAELTSHKIAFTYLNLLEGLYILKQLFWVNPYTLEESFKKPRKIHLQDPAMYSAFARWVGVDPPGAEVRLEAAVATHLARKYRVGYWRNGREIDVIIPELKAGIEVKIGRAGAGGRVGLVKYRELSLPDAAEYLFGEVP
ncbi:MAG: ATP-binding protein [Pyrobaculum sp.]